MKKLKMTKLHREILAMTIIPIILMGCIIALFCAHRFSSSMYQEVQDSLADLCDTIEVSLDELYPGDYHADRTEDAIYFMKGDHVFNGDHELFNAIKEKTDVEITIFYQDIRVGTTLGGEQSDALIGTTVNTVVKKDVLEQEKDAFYSSVLVGDQEYFAYYAPLFGEDGSCIGMLGIGHSVTIMEGLIKKSITPMLYIVFGITILVAIISIRYTSRLVETINEIEVFMANISRGHLREEMDVQVLKRSDELGDMGKSAVKMQGSLRKLVEEDMLTGLYNRRYGEQKLKQNFEDFIKKGSKYCIAIGDVDFFKRVNDTYGHECGDVVLTEVSERLKHFMNEKGKAVRWGGEEFLLVFHDLALNQVSTLLTEFLHDMESHPIIYQDNVQVYVTMTFGVVEAEEQFPSVDSMVSHADRRLYAGKQNGRNQVVARDVENDRDTVAESGQNVTQ